MDPLLCKIARLGAFLTKKRATPLVGFFKNLWSLMGNPGFWFLDFARLKIPRFDMNGKFSIMIPNELN